MTGVPWRPSDVASDADNEWDDPAVVDGHVYMGFTYDYLVARHGWNGIDGRNGRILTMVNIGRDTANIPPPYAGCLREGAKSYGKGLHVERGPAPGHRYSPVRLMCSHPSGETWARNSAGTSRPAFFLVKTASPSFRVFQ